MLFKRIEIVENLFQSWFGTDFEWGMRDCVCLIVSNLFAFGYDVDFKMGVYNSEHTALKTIKKYGYESLEHAVDSQEFLKKISPSEVLPGDILGMRLPKEKEGWIVLTVVLGNGRVFGFFNNEETNQNKCVVMQPKFLKNCIAWRVECPQQ